MQPVTNPLLAPSIREHRPGTDPAQDRSTSPSRRRRAATALALATPCLLWSSTAAAADGSPARAAMLKAEAAYLEAWNRHDAKAVEAAFHPDAVRWTVADGELRGEAIGAAARRAFEIFSDFQVEVLQVAPLDDRRLVKWFVFKGRWTGRFPGGPLADKAPTGRLFSVPAMERLEFSNGLILASHTYWDRMTQLVQIGAIGD